MEYGDVKKEDENKESNYGSSYNTPVLPSSDDNRQLTVDDVLDYIGFGPFQVRLYLINRMPSVGACTDHTTISTLY